MSERVYQLALRIKTLRNATRLWNWIDFQAEPEPLWDAMLRGCPWAFLDASAVNSIRFTY